MLLKDSFSRVIEYLRLSVTDRCDLRCHYCLPEDYKNFVEPETWLTTEEIIRLARIFTEIGVRRIRITGGEPLVRQGITDLLYQLGRLPLLQDLSLSTNATRLERYAASLYAAGVKRLNISLDSLKPEVFQKITKGKLEKVFLGLAAAKKIGFDPIKINMVVMKGINDQEIFDMITFCLSHGFTLRLIETMPMGSSGLDATVDYYVNLQEVKQKISEHYQIIPTTEYGAGPARYFKIISPVNAANFLKIGFITPISQHFCQTCNRVRLTTDGTLYLCLGQEHTLNLRDLLRQGAQDDDIKEAIYQAVMNKPLQHEFQSQPEKVVRFMSFTGG